jgi:PAS domain S-box-containing protein
MSAPRSNSVLTPEFLASVVEHSDDAIITKDLNGRVTSWNKSAERIFGYTAAEMIGNTISILTAPDGIDEMPDIVRRIVQGERIDHCQTLRRTKDGRLLPVSLALSPVKDATGRVIGASKIARDVTEQVREAERLAELNAALLKSETQARQARDWLETMLQGIGDAVIATDADGKITLLNVAAESLTEWRQKETIGRPLDEVFVISNEQSDAAVESPPSSERPPRIHVSAVQENGMWRLAVADNGIGIDPQYHQNVFGVFKRLHGKTIPETGTGLAICQRVVERGGGRIWVGSQAGQGATFHCTLPPLKGTAANGA